jgi:hypothetical protein
MTLGSTARHTSVIRASLLAACLFAHGAQAQQVAGTFTARHYTPPARPEVIFAPVLWVATGNIYLPRVTVPFCVLTGITPFDLKVAFMRFLEAYPNEASFPYPPVILAALIKTYPVI